MKQVFSAVSHCISIGVYNLDIKLENVMFTRSPFVRSLDCVANVRLVEANLGTARIIDWGFSEVVPRNGYISLPAKSDRSVGSDHYVAPEVGYERPLYDMAKASSWNLGVVLYASLSLRLPWVLKVDVNGRRVGKSHVDRANGSYDPLDTSVVSREGADLVDRLIQVQPIDRISVRETLNHAWFKSRTTFLPEERTSSAPIDIKKVETKKTEVPSRGRVHAKP
jgi:serine/threonine protein kinase